MSARMRYLFSMQRFTYSEADGLDLLIELFLRGRAVNSAQLAMDARRGS